MRGCVCGICECVCVHARVYVAIVDCRRESGWGVSFLCKVLPIKGSSAD